MKKFKAFIIAIFWGLSIWGQNKYTISGYVHDSKSGEELTGARIGVKELPAVGITTNSFGFYSLTIPQGNYIATVSFVGYETLSFPINLTKSIIQNFSLSEKVKELNEVVVTSEKRNDNVTKNQMGVEKLNIQEIISIPAFFGERDVLKTLQLLPGIKSAGEGNSGFYVRGVEPTRTLFSWMGP